jgi:magnesium transporter
VKDCLDPEHLPKFEAFDQYTFVILRAWDEVARSTCSTVQELTRKLAIFYAPAFLITIHRTEQPWLAAHQQKIVARIGAGEKPPGKDSVGNHILVKLLNGALDSYQHPMEVMEERLDRFEESVFGGSTLAAQGFRRELREIHLVKRQVTLTKRLLLRTMDVIQRMTPGSGRSAALYRDALENAESYHFYADELLDDVNTLLNVQLALASHRTGEVMRILTLFSAFFLPLTFIVGVYGMNFDYMPELRLRLGYPAVLAAMALVTLAIYVWFRRRGWLRQ